MTRTAQFSNPPAPSSVPRQLAPGGFSVAVMAQGLADVEVAAGARAPAHLAGELE